VSRNTAPAAPSRPHRLHRPQIGLYRSVSELAKCRLDLRRLGLPPFAFPSPGQASFVPRPASSPPILYPSAVSLLDPYCFFFALPLFRSSLSISSRVILKDDGTVVLSGPSCIVQGTARRQAMRQWAITDRPAGRQRRSVALLRHQVRKDYHIGTTPMYSLNKQHTAHL